MALSDWMFRPAGSINATRLALLVLILAPLLACDDAIELDDDLAGEWVRVGFPDCEGTIPLQELPVERRFIYATEMTAEQDQDNIRLIVDGRGVWSATLDGDRLGNAAGYSVAIDADPPLYYYNVQVDRYGQVEEDGARILLFDRYRSMGDYLHCTHEWERP